MTAKEIAQQALESPERLKAWLESKQPNELVGDTGETDSCPLARYLGERGIPTVFVTMRYAYVSLTRHALPEDYLSSAQELPPWAFEFVWSVDSTREENITAKEALVLLEAAVDRAAA